MTTEEDREFKRTRLQLYRDGSWHMIGLFMRADVDVNGETITVRSGGLWGIESDSGRQYLMEVAVEEYDQLERELAGMGVKKIPALRYATWVDRTS